MRLLSALFDTALLPISLVKDICTIGGELTNDEKSAVRQQIEKIEEELS
jgi:hypothetical protein